MKHVVRKVGLVAGLVMGLVACSGDRQVENAEPKIRGLKGYQVSEAAGYEVRRFASLVRPSRESELSFEIGGQLRDLEVEIGERVEQGALIAEIDPASLELQVQQGQAALAQAQASLDQARSDFDRRASLLPKGYITKSEYDIAKSTLDSAIAQQGQAQQQLSINKENLKHSRLLSPFGGTVSNIYVESFEQVSPGQPIVSLYSEAGYETSFSVPASVINDLKVGYKARVLFPDLSMDYYDGVISELGTRAGQVSAFPVVVSILDAPEGLFAGMASDVELQIPVHNLSQGFLIPLSCFDFMLSRDLESGDAYNLEAVVYIFDESTSTVKATTISLGGILGNRVIVRSGLEEGQIIASAGVSFLHDGMQVKLLPLEQ